ncbi:MAG TPA: hypothetical protein VFK05_26285, partial [Polyangiaceae bacterium]|nr:hypothetical protein [Polyangiaceae bacterium]
EAPRSLRLTSEQLARRARLRRAVGAVVLGLSAFTVLAAGIYVVKGRATAASSVADEKTATAAPQEQPAPARAPAPASDTQAAATPQPNTATAQAEPASSETDRVMALARTPVATTERLQSWSALARQLSPSDRKLAEHELSRLSVTGERPIREAARLQLALLWRATDRRAKAHKVLVSLARTASDPLVKKYALDTLATA